MICLPNIFSSYSPVPVSTCVQKYSGNTNFPQIKKSPLIETLFGSSSQRQQLWPRAPGVSPQSPWSFFWISLSMQSMDSLNCPWRNLGPLLFYSSLVMQSGEIIEGKRWEFESSPSPHSNSFSFPFYIYKNGNGNSMLLFGYLLAMLPSLWFILQRKEIIFLKITYLPRSKLDSNVMLTLTFMSYKLTNRVVLRTN